MTSDDLVRRLRALDTSAVSDAMDSLGLDGVATGIPPVWRCGTVAGRVIPVRLVPVGEAEPAPYHLGTAAISAAAPGDVIVVGNDGRTAMGGWGGLLARAALAAQVGGVIVDGSCRDVDEIEAIGFPAYARGATARTARGRVVETPVDRITVDGVNVTAGDLVMADATSVVFVPATDAVNVLDMAERIVAREGAMAEALALGDEPMAIMGLAYEDLLTRLANNIGTDE